MSEFKGTKNRWTKSQIGNGDIQINASGFRNLATVNFYPDGFREKYINGKLTGSPAPDSDQYRRECLYNALLISKAPEMLKMLIDISKTAEKIWEIEQDSPFFDEIDFALLDDLIKEATELK